MPLIDPVRRLWQAIPNNRAKSAVKKVVRSVLPEPFPPSYVAELRLLDVVNAGVSEDHMPYVVLRDGMTFYGTGPLETMGMGGWYYEDLKAYRRLPPDVKAKIPPECIRVALDVVLRYVYPHATPDLPPPPYPYEVRYSHWFGQHANTIDDLEWSDADKTALKSRFALSEGKVVFDVGACYGFGALRYSRMVGSTGRVIAIEADPTIQKIFDRNMEANGNPRNVQLLRCGVWKEKGEFQLHVGSIHRQDNTLRKNSFLHSEDTITIPTKTIDDIVELKGLDRVDLVSLTINTAEIEALQGMDQTIRKFAPCLSMAGWLMRDDEKELYQVLTEILEQYPGYKVVVGRSKRVLAWHEDGSQK